MQVYMCFRFYNIFMTNKSYVALVSLLSLSLILQTNSTWSKYYCSILSYLLHVIAQIQGLKTHGISHK